MKRPVFRLEIQFLASFFRRLHGGTGAALQLAAHGFGPWAQGHDLLPAEGGIELHEALQQLRAHGHRGTFLGLEEASWCQRGLKARAEGPRFDGKAPESWAKDIVENLDLRPSCR